MAAREQLARNQGGPNGTDGPGVKPPGAHITCVMWLLASKALAIKEAQMQGVLRCSGGASWWTLEPTLQVCCGCPRATCSQSTMPKRRILRCSDYDGPVFNMTRAHNERDAFAREQRLCNQEGSNVVSSTAYDGRGSKTSRAQNFVGNPQQQPAIRCCS